MLFAGLQGHAQPHPAGAVLGHTDDASRQQALELVARREECGMGAAVAQRDAEALRVPDGDVHAPFARRSEQGEREQIGRDRDERARGMRRHAQRAVVADGAVGGGILQQRADDVLLLEIEAGGIAHDDVDPARGRARAHHRDRLRVAAAVDQVGELPLVLRGCLGQMHRLGRRRALIEEGGVRDLEPGQVGHHRLEVEQCFEPALRDLGLIRRVRRVPPGVLQHVPLDDGRRDGVVVAHAEVGSEHLVLRREQPQLLEHLALRFGLGNAQGLAQADIGGDDGIDECLE